MKQQQKQADHWARVSAFGWYARRIHNAAIQKYMRGADKDIYNKIRRILNSALKELEDLTISGRDDVCWPPYCEDNMGNCVPCEENGPTTQGEPSEPA